MLLIASHCPCLVSPVFSLCAHEDTENGFDSGSDEASAQNYVIENHIFMTDVICGSCVLHCGRISNEGVHRICVK